MWLTVELIFLSFVVNCQNGSYTIAGSSSLPKLPPLSSKGISPGKFAMAKRVKTSVGAVPVTVCAFFFLRRSQDKPAFHYLIAVF